MKAVSLWQPWATLIAAGAKRVETRSWPPPHDVLGTRVAIHAAKGGLPLRDQAEIIGLPEFAPPLREALGLAAHTPPAAISQALPRGAIVCTVHLARAVPITPDRAARLRDTNPAEFAFGDYTAGRWAWVLEDAQPLGPLPFRGAQGFFQIPLERDGTVQEQLFA